MRPSLRPSPLILAGFALASLSSTACSKEDPTVSSNEYADISASVYCEAALSCPCESYPYASFAECYVELLGDYGSLINMAGIAGMTYDGSCPQAELEYVQNLDCQNYIPPLPSSVCVAPCKPFYGPLTAGSPCEPVAISPDLGLSYSLCAQGLICNGGVCADPCQLVNALPAIGEPCPDFICEEGGMCDPETGTCVAAQTLPGPGQPCLEGACDPMTAVCVPEANTCASLPATGQACIAGQCDVFSYCDPVDDICLAKEAIACGLLGGGGPIPGDGDGDGDPTGDGDGDPTGDGDGDPGGLCESIELPIVSEGDLPYFTEEVTTTMNWTGSCGGAGSEAVFSFVAPVGASYVFNATASFDTVLHVHEGDCAGPELGCDDDGAGGTDSLLTTFIEAGTPVTVIVDGFDDAAGPFSLVIAIE